MKLNHVYRCHKSFVLATLAAIVLGSAQAQAAVINMKEVEKWGPDPDGVTRIAICFEPNNSVDQRNDAPLSLDTPNPSLVVVQEAVKKAIIAAWEVPSKGGLQFIGWGTCDASGITTVQGKEAIGFYIHPDVVTPGCGVGTNARGNSGCKIKPWGNTGSPTKCIDSEGTFPALFDVYRLDCAEQYSVHEIGHALGFVHEWRHPKTSAACRTAADIDNKEPKLSSAQWTDEWDATKYLILNTAYDFNSVMVYWAECAYVTGERFGSKMPNHEDVKALLEAYYYRGRGLKTIVGMAFASNDRVYAWYRDGTASSGNSDMLDSYRAPYRYTLPPGKTVADIVGMAIASNDHVYAWYRDGTASSGNSGDLDSYRAPYRYTLPPGKTVADIIGMAIASNDHVYAWYRDGTASSGNSGDLDSYRAPYRYTLPPGKTVADIVGMDIASNDHVYGWYRDGRASSGNSGDLDSYRAPYRYLTPAVQ